VLEEPLEPFRDGEAPLPPIGPGQTAPTAFRFIGPSTESPGLVK
jgi:hypothetical protein